MRKKEWGREGGECCSSGESDGSGVRREGAKGEGLKGEGTGARGAGRGGKRVQCAWSEVALTWAGQRGQGRPP